MHGQQNLNKKDEQKILHKLWYLYTTLHGVISLKTVTLS